MPVRMRKPWKGGAVTPSTLNDASSIEIERSRIRLSAPSASHV
jgi:hypothetical protein